MGFNADFCEFDITTFPRRKGEHLCLTLTLNPKPCLELTSTLTSTPQLTQPQNMIKHKVNPSLLSLTPHSFHSFCPQSFTPHSSHSRSSILTSHSFIPLSINRHSSHASSCFSSVVATKPCTSTCCSPASLLNSPTYPTNHRPTTSRIWLSLLLSSLGAKNRHTYSIAACVAVGVEALD